MQTSHNFIQSVSNGQQLNGSRGTFIETNDGLAIGALIAAELERPGSGRTIIELTRERQIGPREALYLATCACKAILTGGASVYPDGCSPHPLTFDQADLKQAIALLQQMAYTIEPVTGGIHQSKQEEP